MLNVYAFNMLAVIMWARKDEAHITTQLGEKNTLPACQPARFFQQTGFKKKTSKRFFALHQLACMLAFRSNYASTVSKRRLHFAARALTYHFVARVVFVLLSYFLILRLFHRIRVFFWLCRFQGSTTEAGRCQS